MDDSSEPSRSRSLFAVELCKQDQHLSILRLEEAAAPNLDCLKEHVVRFNLAKVELLPPPSLSLSPPTSTGGEDLYLFPDWCDDAVKPFHGYKFNLRTGSFQNIRLPPSIKQAEGKPPDCAINHGGRIYRMHLADSFFGCYDPINNSWKPLKPFPCDKRFMPIVKATAALNDDTILFNMVGPGFQVYDVCGNEWYFVHVDDYRCYNIIGEAVVLDNTVYAITCLVSDVLLAFSIEKEASDDGDVVFKCSLLSEISMPSMTSIVSEDAILPIFFPLVKSKHLVHLGGVDFCLVRSCGPFSYDDPKRIHVTYMSLAGGKVIVKSGHLFKTRYEKQSEVVLCFSLPERKTTALEEGKQFLFELDPFTAEDHCSIRVRDLPPDVPKVTVTQLEEGFKKYGPIKRDEIKVKNKKGESLDFVQFPRFTSKQHAIKVPQSLFAVVFYFDKPHLSILQLNTPGRVKNTNVDSLKEHVVRFNEANGRWSVSPGISSAGDLYLLPDSCDVKPMHGYKFNFSTGSFQNICLPPSFKQGKPDSVVNLGGRIYRMDLAESVFGCYDPINNSWKALKPFPYDKRFMPRVKATAALNDDTILFNMLGLGFQVYDVRGNEWYFVHVDDCRCYNIVGEAVVLENTIYAVTCLCSDALLALSIGKEVSGGDVVFKCSLHSQIFMPCIMPSLRTIVSWDENRLIPSPLVRTKHLVHLGGVDFCLVRICFPLLSEDPTCIHVTYIHVTYMSLTGGKVIVKSDNLLKTRYEKQSEVVLCFSLPGGYTTALEEGKQFLFELDPFTAGDHSCADLQRTAKMMPSFSKSIFLQAAFQGDVSTLRRLADEYGDGKDLLKVVDAEGCNALHLAAMSGKWLMCKFLLEHLNFIIDSKDRKGNTPLMAAIEGRQSTTAVDLIKKGADIGLPNDRGFAPLHSAARLGQIDIMCLLLSRGFTHFNTGKIYTPLQCACTSGDMNWEAVKFLLDHGAEPDATVEQYESALMICIAFRSLLCMVMLLQANANPNLVSCGTTPLIFAAIKGDATIINLLLDAGADPNVSVVMTPLEAAALYKNIDALNILYPITSRSVDRLLKIEHIPEEEAKQIKLLIGRDQLRRTIDRRIHLIDE